MAIVAPQAPLAEAGAEEGCILLFPHISHRPYDSLAASRPSRSGQGVGLLDYASSADLPPGESLDVNSRRGDAGHPIA